MDSFIANLSSEELRHLLRVFDVQSAIVIVLIAFLTKNFVAKVIIKIYNFFAKRKEKPESSEMYGPIKLMYMFMASYAAIKIVPISLKLSIIMKALLKSAIIVFAINIINSTVFVKDSRLFRKKNKVRNETVSSFICKIARVISWIVAIYIILVFVLGFTQINGLLAGLGVGTVIISLAAQDTVKSLFSGITILSEKPFVVGDWIEIGEYSGTVIDISFRSTRIRSMNNSIITIPNSTVTSEYVINWNKLKSRRVDCLLHLEMNNLNSEKIKDIIKELKVVICAKEYVQRDTVYVGFNGIADYSYVIKIFLYVTETNYTKYLKIQEDLNCEFVNVLEKENVTLAYPTQTINVQNTSKQENL